MQIHTFCMAKEIHGLHVHLHPFQTSEVSNLKLIWPTWIQNTSSTNHTYCSVFSQLAERGEGFLVSFSDLLSEIIQLCCHFIVFCGLLLWRFLLLFVSIISDSCRGTSTDHMWLLRSPPCYACWSTSKHCNFLNMNYTSGDKNIICTENTFTSLITQLHKLNLMG